MKKLLVFFCCIVASALAQNGPAQTAPAPPRIVTRTRLQVVFSQLETQWLKAVQAKDKAGLNKLLAEDFEVWTAASPGEPLPREDWQTAALARKLVSFRIRQMAVRSVRPDVAVASFVLTETFDEAGTAREESHFVVDVWTSSGGDNWRCTDRYWSESSAAGKAATQEIKPTGKQ